MSLSPFPRHGNVEDFEKEVIERLERIEASQIETASLVSQFIEGIRPTVEEALPKITAIAESSWFRMITGGSKKR